MPAARGAGSLAGSVRRRHEVVDLEDSDDEAATPTSPKRQRGTDSDDTQSPLLGRRQQVSAGYDTILVNVSVSAEVHVTHCTARPCSLRSSDTHVLLHVLWACHIRCTAC